MGYDGSVPPPPAPILFAALLLAAPACSDDATPTPPDADIGVTADGGPKPDAPRPDQAVPLSCESACTAQGDHLCVTSPKSGTCVECLTDGHCLGNPGALGQSCQNRLCVCADASDCKGKLAGGQCSGSPGACGCADDGDCPAPRRCIAELFGADVCGVPCTADSACKTKEQPYCDSGSGNCVACLGDSHCTKSGAKICHAGTHTCVACRRDAHCAGSADKPLCSSKTGKCIACRADADCKGHLGGSDCDKGQCTCSSAADCKGPSPWGNACNSGAGRCGCSADADCAGNENGPTCYSKYNKCSCAADSDCGTSPYTTCLVPYSGAAYKHCQVQCSADADCHTTYRPACSSAKQACVACTTDSHCAARPWATRCDAGKARCVECLTSADCGAASLGELCSGEGHCSCQQDSSCAQNANGQRCSPTYSVCGCSKDSHCPAGKTCKGSTAFGTKVCK
jgi:hypothetical protein